MIAASMIVNPSQPILKSYRNGGTHRMVDPDQTVARVWPLLSQMGITRVANITGLDRVGIPVIQVVRPNARSLSVSQGKGLDIAAAKASGIMESVESFHADHITLPVKHARYADLSRTHHLADVTMLNQPKVSNYHADLPIMWIEGFDLLQDEQVWIPFETVNGDFTLPGPAGGGCFAATSNGLASGNHLLEAVGHGICEVVERDATTLWGLLGAKAQEATRIDLQTVPDSACQQVLDRFANADINVGIWETTSDIGIPSFICRIRDSNSRFFANVSLPGYGCHPVRSIALFRALTEAAQTRLTIIAGSRDDLARSRYDQFGSSLVTRHDPAWFDFDGPSRNFASGTTFDSESIDGDVRWLLDCLRAIGIQRVVVVDLTKAEFNLPVVRVVIPGLEMALIDPGHYALGLRAHALLRTRS
jgi:YcaO-like protein with predicted kinase domain